MSTILEPALAQWSPTRAAQCLAADKIDAPIPAPRWQVKAEPTAHERITAMLQAADHTLDAVRNALLAELRGGEWDECADEAERLLTEAAKALDGALGHWEMACPRGEL